MRPRSWLARLPTCPPPPCLPPMLTGGYCRSQLCVDLRRRIEHGGIRFEDHCDNGLLHARRESIRLRLRIVKLILGTDVIDLRSLFSESFLHSLAAHAMSLPWR
jgi:hypothetical protein